MAGQLWEVVGGGDKGGIIVRTGVEVTSTQEATRLSTGALVRELELAGERLHYEFLSGGGGPATGWVSTTLKDGKVLMARSSKAPPEEPPLPKFHCATSRISRDTPSIEPISEELRASMVPFDNSKMMEAYMNMGNNEPGLHYGMHFPHTPQQVEEWGASWLTTAFHAAGTLPKDNSVKSIVSVKAFPGGGAGMKVVLVVEYEKPSEDLHTDLFVKLPLDPSEKNRSFCVMLNMEPSEVIFNRFMIRCLPIRAPKYYFGDVNPKTTNWILISEKLPFADKSLRGQRLAPFELEPPVLKGMDWVLPDRVDKYYALWRTNAIMAAWGHSGKLGDLCKLYGKPNTERNVLFPVPEKRFDPFWKQTEDFIMNVATPCFPKDIADAKYMAQLEKEIKEVTANIHCFNDHLKAISKDFWGLIHANSHIDNSFFWVDEEGRTDAGLLDFGGLGLALFGPTLASNMMASDAGVRAEHLEGLSHCFVQTLHEFGGPKISGSDLHFNVAVVDMKSVAGSMMTIESGGFGGLYEHKPKDQWKNVTGLNDPIFEVEDIATMMVRTGLISLVECIKTWKLANHYDKFCRWREKFGKTKKK